MTTKPTKTLIFASIVTAALIAGTFTITADAISEKDYRNYEAEEIQRELIKYTIVNIGEERNLTVEQKQEVERLTAAFEKSQIDHRAKHIDQKLQDRLLDAHKKMSESDLPVKLLDTGPGHLLIQLSNENGASLESADEIAYKNQIDSMIDVPYNLNFGEGMNRGSCNSTTSDCNPEIGGLKIQTKMGLTLSICSLSVQMQKNNVDGFLTAGHCFPSSGTGDVYQPTNPNGKIWYSTSSDRIFVDGGTCDCAWINDTS